MNIRKTIKTSMILFVAPMIFSGCASTTHNGNYRNIDSDMKKAILILAKKVERLEKLNGIRSRPLEKQRRIVSAMLPTSNARQRGGSFSKICTQDVVVFSRDIEANIAERIGVIKAGNEIRVSSCDDSGWCFLEGRRKSVREWELHKC